MDGHCLSPYTCKCCIVFKQFDGLNFDSLAGKHQKCQNFPPSKFCTVRSMYTGLYFTVTNHSGPKCFNIKSYKITTLELRHTQVNIWGRA